MCIRDSLYLQWVLQPSYEMIVVCGTLILGIVLFSVVVIYNIFQVGIAQKVQEYGKIKALGATRKQMKQLIFREGILLAVPSIPLGPVSYTHLHGKKLGMDLFTGRGKLTADLTERGAGIIRIFILCDDAAADLCLDVRQRLQFIKKSGKTVGIFLFHTTVAFDARNIFKLSGNLQKLCAA